MMGSFAQLAVGRVVNSLPEGLLIALGAWLLLRLLGKQNSGTRFAVWMVALAGVALLPFLGSFGDARPIPGEHPEIAVPTLWATSFFVLWIVIATLALARVAVGVWQVRQIRRSCAEIRPENLDPALLGLLRQVKRPVRLLTAENARVPAAIGFRNPAVVLPAWALRELSTDELRPILIHELAHLRRHDDWTNLLQKAVRAVLFFHPAVWWIDSRLSIEREMACDDAVLAATGNPHAYAGCLIDLLERSCARRGWTMAQAAVARAREASLRIARILRMGAPASTRVGRLALGLSAAVSLACSGVLLCTPRLLVFAPEGSHAVAQETARPPLENDVRFLSAPAIPAAYHPDENRSGIHEATLTRKAPLRKAVVARKTHTVPRHVELAGLSRPVPAPAPVQTASFFMIETAATQPVLASTPQQVNSDPALRQPAAGAAVQVQMLQFVEASASGVRIQTIRVVFVVPSQNLLDMGSVAQSI